MPGRIETTARWGNFVNLSASGLVFTGPVALQGVVINSQSSGTLKLWNNTSAATTVAFNTITFTATDRYIDLFGAFCNIGCYATIGGTADLTIIYN